MSAARLSPAPCRGSHNIFLFAIYRFWQCLQHKKDKNKINLTENFVSTSKSTLLANQASTIINNESLENWTFSVENVTGSIRAIISVRSFFIFWYRSLNCIILNWYNNTIISFKIQPCIFTSKHVRLLFLIECLLHQFVTHQHWSTRDGSLWRKWGVGALVVGSLLLLLLVLLLL